MTRLTEIKKGIIHAEVCLVKTLEIKKKCLIEPFN